MALLAPTPGLARLVGDTQHMSVHAAPPIIRQRVSHAAPLLDLHPVVARVLAARAITRMDQLDPSLKHLHAPDLKDCDHAVDRLISAMQTGQQVLVVGDFDADGATSVALMVRCLRAFGHDRVDYIVPNRFEFGYGLSPELVERIAEDRPGLIVTVDNGIASHEGIAAAQALDMDVIVTDHHLPGDSLPAAVAVVNPNRADCPFPSGNLAGVGVAFYLMARLRTVLAERGWFEQQGIDPPPVSTWLDLVALGTVADVVRLDRNNRILVEQGLRRIRAGHACPGIAALLRNARREPARTVASDLGYAVAPRLNAAGRLADISIGIETLLADSASVAQEHAAALDTLNQERRAIESEMKSQAEAELDRLRAKLAANTELPVGLVLHDDRWHQGVIGILAGRVRESVYRPTVILADAGDGMLKGSARSIPDLHIRDVLATVDAQHPHLIERFGGHAMAAGLTLRTDAIEAFRHAFVGAIDQALEGRTPERIILTDGELAGSEIGLETAEALRCVGPWGAGFPEPLFEGTFDVLDARTVGEHHLKLTVRSADGSATAESIAFNTPAHLRENPGRQVRLVYRLEVNEFRGRRTPQLVVEHLSRLR